MQRFVLSFACAAALVAAPAIAQPAKAPAEKAPAAKAEATKTASGTITSVAGSSVTVKTATGDMTFNIDSKTRVIEPGGGTRNRAAQAEGKAGAAATDVLKTGQSVEVKYHETGMHAASIRTIGRAPASGSAPPPPPPPAKAGAAASGGEGAPAPAKSQTANGTVSSVSGNTLTVKGAKGDMTFTVDEKTTVIGKGMGTAGRKLKAEGAKPTLGEFVKEGDSVTVTYRDMAGTNHASTIRVASRKP